MVQYSEMEVCRMFHALGDPTRLAILRQISLGEAPARELAKPRKITLTATLKHLRILEAAGLTETVKVGRERRCRMKTERLAEIEAWVAETRRSWNFRLDQLELFLKESKESHE
jgi:DNA-binding transcriptional ArsR family regulator